MAVGTETRPPVPLPLLELLEEAELDDAGVDVVEGAAELDQELELEDGESVVHCWVELVGEGDVHWLEVLAGAGEDH